jgi:hypothetical protein
MEGVSIVSTEILTSLISKIDMMGAHIEQVTEELKQTKKPYLTAQEVMEITGFSRDWITDHKHDIGCSTKGGKLIFKRKDLDAFIEEDYYKSKRKK